MSFKKDRQLLLVNETEREYSLTLDKNIKLFPGHRYQLYFWQLGELDSRYDHYSTYFLGYEELFVDSKKTDCI